MKVLLSFLTAILLVGCGSSESDTSTKREDTVGTEIADGYNNAMNKARNVENLSFEQKDRMDAALEDAEGEKREKP